LETPYKKCYTIYYKKAKSILKYRKFKEVTKVLKQDKCEKCLSLFLKEEGFILQGLKIVF